MRTVAEHRAYLESLAAKLPNPVTGFFGPGSMVWRLNREMVLGVVVLRALFMQVAHPKVAQGVAEHSDFRQKPLARAIATFKAQQRIFFDFLARTSRFLISYTPKFLHTSPMYWLALRRVNASQRS